MHWLGSGRGHGELHPGFGLPVVSGWCQCHGRHDTVPSRSPGRVAPAPLDRGLGTQGRPEVAGSHMHPVLTPISPSLPPPPPRYKF